MNWQCYVTHSYKLRNVELVISDRAAQSFSGLGLLAKNGLFAVAAYESCLGQVSCCMYYSNL